MKRRFRAVLAVVLCLLIAAGSFAGPGVDFSVTADAAGLVSGECGSNAEYRFDSSSGTLTISGSGSMENYGYSLSPFFDNSAIRSVVIENGITGIGSYAFPRCKGIMNVDIPESVEFIGEGAFSQCSGLSGILLPGSLEAIGKEAFISCTGMKKINIPAGVLEIGTGILNECTGIKSVSVDGNNPRYDSRENCNAIIKTTGNILISGCSETVIPESVTAVGENAFRGQKNLKNIGIPGGVTAIGADAFRDCTGLEEIILPDSLTNLGAEAFYKCSGLTKITIPDGITKIPEKAFAFCTGLAELNLHSRITNVGPSAFGGCSGLVEVDIPDSVISIGEYAFFQCAGIEEIIIPAAVSSIGRCAFSGCTALSSVRVEAANQIFDSRYNCNAVIKTSTNSLLFGCMASVIDSSVTSISEYAFYLCSGITSINIPNSVKAIGTDAFYGVANINYYGTATGSKWGAENINCHVYGDLVYSSEQRKKIVGCRKSISGELVIPNSVTSISAGVFEGCTGLTAVTFSENLISIGDRAFYQCTGLRKIIIPDNVTVIGSETFCECSGVENIVLSDNLESIGEKAFYQCSRVTNVRIPDCVSFIGISAFENIMNIVYHGTASGSRWGAKNLNCYVEGALIYSDIYKKVIVGCSRSAAGELIIPASVTNIAVGAFNESEGISAIYVDSDNPEYDSRNNCNAIIHTSTNTLILGLASTEIPDNVSCIAAYAFCNCRGLKEVILPESVTVIDERAFYCCSDLESIAMTDKVTGIGEYAFCNCTGLREIDIPDSVAQIGRYAFAGCTGLTELVLPDGLGIISSGLFSGCTEITSVTVPPSVRKIENLASDGCLSLEDINYSGSYAQSMELQIMNNGGGNNPIILARWQYNLPESLSVSTLPAKTVYHEDETIDISGLEITAEYSNGFSEVLDTYYTYSPSVTGAAGKQKITVAYMGSETDFEVTVEHVFSHYIYNYDESVGVDGTETAKCDYCDETHTRTVEGTAKPYPSYEIKNKALYDGQTIDYRSSLEISAEVGNCTDIEWCVSGASFRKISENCIEIEEAKGNFSVYFTAKDLDGNKVESEKETVYVRQGFFDKLVAFFRGLFGKLPKLRQQ